MVWFADSHALLACAANYAVNYSVNATERVLVKLRGFFLLFCVPWLLTHGVRPARRRIPDNALLPVIERAKIHISESSERIL